MANSDKGESEDTQTSDRVDEITQEVNEDAATQDSAAEDETPDAEADAAADDASGSTPGEAPEPEETPDTDVTPAAPEPLRETVIERKGGFVPMVLGGAFAAGLGVLSAGYIFPDGLPFGPQATDEIDLQSALTVQTGRIDTLSSKLDQLPDVDTAALEAAVSAVGDLQAQIGAVVERIDGFESRLDALEARPAADGSGVSAGMVREIEELRAALDTQKGELAQMLDAAQAKEQSAEETARQTMARAAVTRILVALDSGAPFADALAEVEANTDAPIADALQQTAREGVPKLSALSEAFPDAARNALAAARSEEGAGGGVGSFLTRQLGVRSVAPREGDDPDAVLSRAQAAVNEGRIADALAEAETLPEPARAALADWTAQARLRLSAAQEAEALANSLNSQ